MEIWLAGVTYSLDDPLSDPIYGATSRLAALSWLQEALGEYPEALEMLDRIWNLEHHGGVIRFTAEEDEPVAWLRMISVA